MKLAWLRTTLLGLCPVLLGLSAHAEAPGLPSEPVNLQLQSGEAGLEIEGWFMPRGSRDKGYELRLTRDGGREGRLCAEISRDVGSKQDGFGNLMQSISAEAYRGKRIRFAAFVRAEVDGARGQVQLWLRVDRPNRAMGFFDNMGDRPIVGGRWKRYEIVGDVAEDAVSINFGVFLSGNGVARFDAASLEIVGDATVEREPPRELTESGLENLVALARLLGYVRYFHPSDEVAEADWGRFAIGAIGQVEPASGPGDLARRLQALFRPVAPTLSVFSTSEGPPDLFELPAPSDDARRVAWRHHGVGTGNPRSIYSSARPGRDELAPSEGYFYRVFDADDYHGKRIRLRGLARSEVAGYGNEAGLALLVYTADGTSRFKDEMKDAPIIDPDWRSYEIAADIAGDAAQVMVGVVVRGNGRAWFADLALETLGDGEQVVDRTALPFDSDDRAEHAEWAFADQGLMTEYNGTLDDSCRGRSGACAQIEGEPSAFLSALPEEPLRRELGAGVAALVPLTLYTDGETTIPPASSDAPVSTLPASWLPSGDDRATRLGNVILAWNVFQHFYPYFDVVDADWDAALPEALVAAAQDRDERAFLDTLRRLVAGLSDGHGRVSHSSEDVASALPVLWEWIEDRLVITAVAPEVAEELRPGDVVLQIDGRPAREVLDAREQLISSATPQWRRVMGLRTLRTGPPNSEVTLEVQRGHGPNRTLRLVRTHPAYGEGSLEERRPDVVEELRPGVFYVDLSRLTQAFWDERISSFAEAQGMIFDLRGYPAQFSMMDVLGSLTDGPVTSAQWQVPVVTLPDREGMTFDSRNWTVQPKAPRLKGKIVFLTDGRAISAAETFMGIVEHYRLGAIVGAATAGTNGNINPFKLPGGYQLSWTGMRVLKHDGSQHHGVGTLPTHPASRTLVGVTAGRDELLERGLELASAEP